MVRAAPREAFGLSIASGCPFESPTLGTHVPKGIEPIGSWRMGKEPAQCLKYLHIPERKFQTSVPTSNPFIYRQHA